MSDNENVSRQVVEWLSLRLDRANFVEKRLNELIKRKGMTEEEQKQYNDLVIDSKNIGVKEILSIYEAMKDDSVTSGFEDFD